MIDLGALQTLHTVRQEGSLTGAADVLGMTTSAVSQQMKRLERQTGVQLLERVGRGIALTEIGRQLADEGAGLVADAEALRSRLYAAGTGAGPVVATIRVAAFSTSIRGLLGPVLRRLAETDPGLDVRIHEHDPHEAIDLVARGHVDAALVHNWGDLPLPIPDHVSSVRLGIDHADVLVPAGHPLAAAGVVRPADLPGLRWTCAPPGSVCHGWLVHLHDQHGLSPDVRHWAMEFSSQIGLVEHGLAVALVPRLGRERLPAGVSAVPLQEPVTRRILHLWRHSMAPSPGIRRLHEALCECFVDPAG